MAGAGDFLYFELPFLRFAEASGHPIGYATDIDLHADPHLLDGARAVITLGHDEYWSAAMRNQVVHARDTGTNLAFLGGNEIYRHIRLDPTPLGPDRLEIDYKSFTEDPASTTNPLTATQEWRSPPTPRPESAILGNFYQCNPVSADLVVADPGNWLLAGIVTDGQKLPGMVGNEYAQVDLGVPTPRPLEVLFHSPLTCQHRPGFADVTYYTAPSGAGVFSAGTQWWICGVDPGLHEARCRRSRRRAHNQRHHHPPPRRLRPGPRRRAAFGGGQPATPPHPRRRRPDTRHAAQRFRTRVNPEVRVPPRGGATRTASEIAPDGRLTAALPVLRVW